MHGLSKRVDDASLPYIRLFFNKLRRLSDHTCASRSSVLRPVPVPVRSAALWTVLPPTLSLSLSLSLVRLCDVVGSGRHCSALFVLSQGRGGRDPESEYEREMDSRRLNAQLAHSVRDRFYSETRYARRDGSVSPVRSVAS